jgi:hypothetical protein
MIRSFASRDTEDLYSLSRRERGVSALCFVWRDGDTFAVEILDYH